MRTKIETTLQELLEQKVAASRGRGQSVRRAAVNTA